MRALLLISVVAASALFSAPVHAGFVHFGNADPTTEGWGIVGPGTGTSASPVTNDLGIDAWNITDTSSVAGSILGYTQVPTVAEVTQATLLGWRLSGILRVVPANDTPDSSAIIEFSTGTRTYSMDFGSTGGDPSVVLREGFDGSTLGPTYTLSGAGSTYHRYDLIFNPTSASANLYIDDILRISGYTGEATTISRRVIWGAVGSVTQAPSTNYNLVEWSAVSAVPEPSSMLLLGFGCCGMLACARRQRKSQRIQSL